MKIGILGGSFNPAHEGHLHISLKALRIFDLDEVWLLVTPGNPLKPNSDKSEFQKRFESAKKIAQPYKNIKATGIEKELGTIYTIDTLLKLKQKFPEHDFIWLMGADNLIQIPKWKSWKKIFDLVPIAVFDRDDCSEKALSGEAVKVFSNYKIDEGNAKKMPFMSTPAWCFIKGQKITVSSTLIRKNKYL